MSSPLEVFFALLIGHALADFALQPPLMAKAKSPRYQPDPSEIPAGQKVMPTWPFWLSSHALIHAGAVWFATGSVALGLAEGIAHWFIDLAKCYNRTNPLTDQALHFACKVVWLIVWMTCTS